MRTNLTKPPHHLKFWLAVNRLLPPANDLLSLSPPLMNLLRQKNLPNVPNFKPHHNLCQKPPYLVRISLFSTTMCMTLENLPKPLYAVHP